MSTIAAISTAPSIGGIGIIRISGKKCFEIIAKIFQTKNKEVKGQTIKYGHIIDPENNEIIDEVLVSFFEGPKSYTKEDMCEINAHRKHGYNKKNIRNLPKKWCHFSYARGIYTKSFFKWKN